MAPRRRKPESHKLLEEKFREDCERIKRKVDDDHKALCALIAERRTEAKLTRRQLAQLAGISEYTVRNIEHQKCNSIAPDTLNRLRSVPALRLSIEPTNETNIPSPWYSAAWLPGYEPDYGTRLIHSAIRWKWKRLPYFSLQHSKKSTDIYQQLINCGTYGNIMREVASAARLIARCINQWVHDRFEMYCLTVGHGWAEIDIAQHLINESKNFLSHVWLVSPNIHLLTHGIRSFSGESQQSSDSPSLVKMVLGRHEEFVTCLNAQKNHRKVFILLGTLMNHDNCSELIQSITNRAQRGDMLVFDVNLPSGDIYEPKEILENDPRLSGQLPKSYIEAVENAIAASVEEIDPTITGIDWSYEIDSDKRQQNKNLEAYSVNMKARIHRDHTSPEMFSVLRIHRHSPQMLSLDLGTKGWKLVAGVPLGVIKEASYPGNVLFFLKND